MKTIASRQNSWFKRLKDAQREHRHEIVLEGRKQIDDALRAGWAPIALVYRTEAPAQRREEIAFAAELFDQLADTRSPQNVIGLFERPRATLADVIGREALIVALDGVQDPGNVGTIVRLAAAFDCAGVALLPGCADAFAPKAIRASVGAVLQVPVVSATAAQLIAARRPLYAADADGSPATPPRSCVLVFGSEGAGVSDEIRRVATLVSVRTSGRVESLNVAASAAILLHAAFVA